jgi:hypothetical protein
VIIATPEAALFVTKMPLKKREMSDERERERGRERERKRGRQRERKKRERLPYSCAIPRFL